MEPSVERSSDWFFAMVSEVVDVLLCRELMCTQCWNIWRSTALVERVHTKDGALHNYLVDLLRPIDWQGGGLGESLEGCCKWIQLA